MSEDASGRAQDGMVTLQGDEGQTFKCQLLEIFEMEDSEYAILMRLEPVEDQGMVIMRLVERDGQNLFQTIDDDAEFDRVVAHVHEMAEALQDEHEHL